MVKECNCVDYLPHSIDCFGFQKLCKEIKKPTNILEGTKHDDGKPPLALLSSSALIEISKVLAFGARKYDPWNWKGGVAWSRLASAAFRHLFAWLAGEDKDPESGLSHLAHCSCCLMFLLDFEVNKLGKDDRYKASSIS